MGNARLPPPMPQQSRQQPSAEGASATMAKSNSNIGCAIDGSAQPSCSSSSNTLLPVKRTHVYSTNQIVWCLGFGPMWPALIERTSDDMPKESQLYLVRFFADGRG